VPALLVLRRLRLLRTRLVVTNQVFFGPRWGRYADRVIVYSRRETEGRPGYRYLPIPADGDFDAVVPHHEEMPYVFTGGAALRDFGSVVEAVRGTGLRLVIVTDGPETLGIEGPLPDGCEARWRMSLQEFLGWAAGALCVVVPLHPGDAPHGHTTVAQALCLGRAVVTTAGASVDDYVRDGIEGRLVEAGDVAGYRAALLELTGDEALRARFEDAARARAPEFSYAAFADGLETICRELLGADA
jgi:glycosyltransferase involved in cell wall biosynthesis